MLMWIREFFVQLAERQRSSRVWSVPADMAPNRIQAGRNHARHRNCKLLLVIVVRSTDRLCGRRHMRGQYRTGMYRLLVLAALLRERSRLRAGKTHLVQTYRRYCDVGTLTEQVCTETAALPAQQEQPMRARKRKNSFWFNVLDVHSRMQQFQEISVKRALYARTVFHVCRDAWYRKGGVPFAQCGVPWILGKK